MGHLSEDLTALFFRVRGALRSGGVDDFARNGRGLKSKNKSQAGGVCHLPLKTK